MVRDEVQIKSEIEELINELNSIDRSTLPYLETYSLEVNHTYNKNYDDDKVCECGHLYYRHFDTYENMESVGCKYCGCWEFKEKK